MESFLAGAVAGFAVDVSLFPLDTVKTRIQSKEGFTKAGGFTNIYRGLGITALGSVPGAGLFFGTYDTVKYLLIAEEPVILGRQKTPSGAPLVIKHQVAATFGEAAACSVRVPVEMIKQQMQAGQHRSMQAAAQSIWKTSGAKGFYKGYGITMFREVPFAMIQFPIYEWFKRKINSESAFYRAVGGSVAGGIAAALTTPLDVAKTRIMLNQSKSKEFFLVPLEVYREEGPAALFKGVGPRVIWISVGGAVFFGAYEFSKGLMPGAKKQSQPVVGVPSPY